MQLATSEKIAEYRARGWWGDRTLYDLFMDAVRADPDAEAAVDAPNRADFFGDSPRRATWSELSAQTENTARVLHDLGLRRGDRILMQLPNIVDVVAMYMACAKLGLILSPLPVQYGAFEIEHAVDTLSPSAFIVARRFKDRPLAKQAAEAVGGRTRILAVGPAEPADDHFDLLEAARRVPEGDTPPDRVGTADDCFTVCWTSGTTGTPKGVPRSHNHWMAITPGPYEGMQLLAGDVLLNPFPLTNMAAIAGMLCPWLQTRGRVILHHPFELPIFLKQLVAEGVTVSVAPPALLTILLKQAPLLDSLDLSKLRILGSGSAPLSEFMVAGWKGRGIEVVNLFGSNEGLSLVTGPREAESAAKRAKFFPRFGHPGADFENTLHHSVKTKLVDSQTSEVIDEPGRDGELLIKGPAVFEGYWGASPEEQRTVFDDDGYFRTGDVFRVADEDSNYLEFVGRSKDIIIRGGANISSAELDTLLEGHPKLAEAAVFAVADDVMGERIGVAAVPKADETVSLEDIVSYLKDKSIAAFKLPEHLLVVDALPRNPMNKVLRFQLKDLFAENQP